MPKREHDCDPVGLQEIAARLGVAVETPKMWRKRGLLPPPRWTVAGRPAWPWEAILQWARDTGRAATPES